MKICTLSESLQLSLSLCLLENWHAELYSPEMGRRRLLSTEFHQITVQRICIWQTPIMSSSFPIRTFVLDSQCEYTAHSWDIGEIKVKTEEKTVEGRLLNKENLKALIYILRAMRKKKCFNHETRIVYYGKGTVIFLPTKVKYRMYIKNKTKKPSQKGEKNIKEMLNKIQQKVN